MENLRTSVLKGMSQHPVACDDATIDALVAKVRARNPENPTGYAYIVGKNYALDHLRAAKAQARRQLAKQTESDRLAREAVQKEETRLLHVRLRDEFLDLSAKLVPTIRKSQLKQPGVVRLVCFEGANSSVCAERFPESTPDARYQWKRRGLKLIWPFASADLRQYLRAFTHSPEAPTAALP